MALFESITNFITGDESGSSFTLRTTFLSGLIFAVAGVSIKLFADYLGGLISDD